MRKREREREGDRGEKPSGAIKSSREESSPVAYRDKLARRGPLAANKTQSNTAEATMKSFRQRSDKKSRQLRRSPATINPRQLPVRRGSTTVFSSVCNQNRLVLSVVRFRLSYRFRLSIFVQKYNNYYNLK